jgi:hypothetical protein
MPEKTSRTARATEASSEAAARRAIEDPATLAKVARRFRAALALGLVDRDGHVVDHQQLRRDAAAEEVQ